ncbi:hypothetical protein ACF8GB_19150 [Pseudomonas sp. xss_4]|uniref:hypothetical protein n=1 Tax=Pseudomonas sp. xss_4 TaxID=3367216 RepID=UPI00370BE3E0
MKLFSNLNAWHYKLIKVIIITIIAVLVQPLMYELLKKIVEFYNFHMGVPSPIVMPKYIVQHVNTPMENFKGYLAIVAPLIYLALLLNITKPFLKK